MMLSNPLQGPATDSYAEQQQQQQSAATRKRNRKQQTVDNSPVVAARQNKRIKIGSEMQPTLAPAPHMLRQSAQVSKQPSAKSPPP